MTSQIYVFISVPLAWALLTGVLLHPYKRSMTNKLRQALMKIQQNEMNAGLTVVKSLLSSIGRYSVHNVGNVDTPLLYRDTAKCLCLAVTQINVIKYGL